MSKKCPLLFILLLILCFGLAAGTGIRTVHASYEYVITLDWEDNSDREEVRPVIGSQENMPSFTLAIEAMDGVNYTIENPFRFTMETEWDKWTAAQDPNVWTYTFTVPDSIEAFDMRFHSVILNSKIDHYVVELYSDNPYIMPSLDPWATEAHFVASLINATVEARFIDIGKELTDDELLAMKYEISGIPTLIPMAYYWSNYPDQIYALRNGSVEFERIPEGKYTVSVDGDLPEDYIHPKSSVIKVTENYHEVFFVFAKAHTLTVEKEVIGKDREFGFTLDLQSLNYQCNRMMRKSPDPIDFCFPVFDMVDLPWTKYDSSGETVDSGLLSSGVTADDLYLDTWEEVEALLGRSDQLDIPRYDWDKYYEEVDGKYHLIIPRNKLSFSFTLKNGESISFTLPSQVEYHITEDDADKYGYITEVTGNESGVTDDMAGDTTVKYTNTYDPLDISGQKMWNDADDQDGIRPSSVTIRLLANGKEVGDTTASFPDWIWTFEGLPKKDDKGNDITYTVTEDGVPGYDTEVNGYTVINTHKPEKITISGSKTWNDEDDSDGIRPSSVTIRLLAYGEPAGPPTTASAPDWSWEFAELPKNENGSAIPYSIAEDEVPGYDTLVNGFNVTNTHIPEKITISGFKEWNDDHNRDGIRPSSVTIRLLADGQPTGRQTTASAPDWSWEFTDVLKKNKGNDITYTVTEDEVPGYDTKVGGYIVINTHKPEQITISGSKTWNDENDSDGIRPSSVTIQLLKNGYPYLNSVTASAPDWSWEFTNLPKNENGSAIQYTIMEVEVPGYDTLVDGFNVTNTHIPEKITISGSKTWNDDQNRDGIRPSSVTIRLLADGQPTGRQTTASAPDWSWEFTDVLKKNKGNDITYTVSEDEVPGYDTLVDGFDVTNTHEPEKITISGSKTWNDDDDRDGIRPASVTVRLLANGEEVGNTTASAPDWSWEFTGVPKNKNGSAITYTITEDPVTGYETLADGYNVTNTHEPEKTGLSVAKVWDDDNDHDRIRPASVTVKLLADGRDTGRSAVLDESNGWRAEFKDLFLRANGDPITYTIEEVLTDVITGEDGLGTYAAAVSGPEGGLFTVTNRHTPMLIDIEAAKVWHDNNNKKGKRPARISVDLYANGEATGKILVLSEENSWKGMFTGLLKYQDGAEVVYSLKELDLPSGYDVNYYGSAEEGLLWILNHEKPTPPPFFELEKELPKTGITLSPSMLTERPASVSYLPMNMKLQIPSLDLSMDIVNVSETGGEYPVEWLGMDAGLLDGTARPGHGPAVIVGHNTLNSEDYGPFVRISMLNPGDRFFIRTEDGRLIGYEVYANEKIGSHDAAGLYRIASAFESTVTLLTCEDERPEGGYASRRIVTAKQVF